MPMFNRRNKNQNDRGHTKGRAGFTLLEMIVSVGLFAVVATIALGALLVSTTANRKSKTERVALDSLGFVLDDITQNVRFGSNYNCNSTGTPVLVECTGSILSLTDANGATVRYRRNTTTGAIERDTGAGWIRVSDPSVNVAALSFTVRGNTPLFRYPRVSVRMRGTARNLDTKTESSFALQTTITKRNAIAQ